MPPPNSSSLSLYLEAKYLEIKDTTGKWPIESTKQGSLELTETEPTLREAAWVRAR